MKSFNSKKSRKLNSFYLDNKNNINLSTTSSRQTSTATNTLDTSFNGNSSFNNYTTSTLQNNTHYSGLCNGMTSKNASTISVFPSSINYGNVQIMKECFEERILKAKYFMKNIRHYNSMFSFTSMGGKIDSSINRGNVPYIFRLGGQNYHNIGSLLPPDGSQPKFSQLYIYDTDNENSNRQRCFGGEKHQSTSIDNDIIEDLKLMLDSNNVLVRSYRMVRDTFKKYPQVDMKLKIIGRRDRDGRTYNLPTTSEVAALIIGDISDSVENKDIVVETKSGFLQRISELHPSYLPLQYPLLFSYGDDGYNIDILHRGVTSTTTNKRENVQRENFSVLEFKTGIIRSHLFLIQKDAYTMIETERLYYIRRQHDVLICESYENLRNQKAQGTTYISNVGQHVILPSYFTGGARYMLQNYLDDMSLCKWFGYPYFFITFTCNPKWSEVKMFLKDTSLQPEDKPDILCRLFKIKLDAFIKDLRENHIFGILFIQLNFKNEIPNIDEDPKLYSLVNEFMIHSPCGAENINCPCMGDKKCLENFPKQFCNHASVDQNGFPLYRRINDGCEGPDRATVGIVQRKNDCDTNDAVDEINEYYDNRYLSACEASWRIFKYDVHYRYPSIVRLPFHLPGQQQIIYGEDDDIDDVLDKPSVASSMFTAWMECNAVNADARKLTYVEFPTKIWKPRKVGKCIGRIHLVSPNLGEAYFLRILLNKVKGPKSFEEICIINGEEYSSFRDACYALGLLDDDKKYIDEIKEASHSGSGFYLRFLFATLLMCNTMSKPEVVWENVTSPFFTVRKDRFCLCFIKIRVLFLIKMLRNLFPVKHDKYVNKAFMKKCIFIRFKTFGMSSSIQKHKHKQNLHSLSLVIYISLISQCNVTSYQHL
uniref:Helitron helicase-like domain-containing protein n=1 Tax=Lactuca sativa TaxID=4236 RepID=A0A9R1V4W3_LACSA|nr:hypothetical protein LSAT_V11C600319750 [Lactuca sativa]